MRVELKDKRVLVLGLGDTGLSALRWLKSQGALVSAADTRDMPPGLEVVKVVMPDIAIHLGSLQPSLFAMADLVVVSPGVSLNEPEIKAAIARGTPVIGDVELFAQYLPAHTKVIAITGTNGKSTVTSLVGEMCKEAGLKTIVAGNIGMPVLDALGGDVPDVYVLELSSFQLESTSSLQPDAATVLNVTADHMDRYADITQYALAKARIFNGHGVQVLNRQDDHSLAMAQPDRQVVCFGTDTIEQDNSFGLAQRHGQTWLMQGALELMPVTDMKIVGQHNIANALAAMALVRAITIEYKPILAALRKFKGLAHRVEWIGNVSGVDYFDDSKGTNVGATCAALAAFRQKVVLIAGGDGKGQDFLPLRHSVERNARAVVYIGRDGLQIFNALKDLGVPLISAKSMEEAVSASHDIAQSGDAVLLSPACASWDMFRDYVHRADVFVAAVRGLEVTC